MMHIDTHNRLFYLKNVISTEELAHNGDQLPFQNSSNKKIYEKGNFNTYFFSNFVQCNEYCFSLLHNYTN